MKNHKSKFRYGISLFAVFFAMTEIAWANKTSFELSGSAMTKKNDPENEAVKSSRFEGRANVHLSTKVGDQALKATSIRIKAGTHKMDTLPEIDRDISIYQTGVGFSYMTINTKRELFGGFLSALASGESGEDPNWQPVAAGLGSSKLGDTTNGIYGLVYSQVIGRNLLLPILGITWRASDTVRVNFILPLVLTVTNDLKNDFKLQFYIKPNGVHSEVANKNSFAGRPDEITYRYREMKFGTRVVWSPGERGENIYYADLGVAGRRQVTFVDDSTDLYQKDLASSLYIGVGLKFGFGENDIEFENAGLDQLQ